MIKCTKCLMPSILYQKYSGLHLCKTHFFNDLEKKFKLTMRNEYKLQKEECIIIALSGGKDSSVVLYLFNKFFGNRKDMKIIAITINEGISNYRENSIKNAVEFTKKINIDHKIFSFENEYSTTMDELVLSKNILNYKKDTLKKVKGACSYCGVLRKRLLNKIAKQLGGTKLVIGHNLDDEAQTILLNYLSGSIKKMEYFSTSKKKIGFVNRIKPLKRISEQEIGLYAYLKKLPMELAPCPYSFGALRKEIRIFLNSFELNHPGVKYSILNGFKELSNNVFLSLNKNELIYCEYCGEPCSNSICQACKLLLI